MSNENIQPNEIDAYEPTQVEAFAAIFTTEDDDEVVAYLLATAARISQEEVSELREELAEAREQLGRFISQAKHLDDALGVCLKQRDDLAVAFREAGDKIAALESATAPAPVADDGEWCDLGPDEIVQEGDRYRLADDASDPWIIVESTYAYKCGTLIGLDIQRRKPTDLLDDGTAVPDWAKGHGSWKGWKLGGTENYPWLRYESDRLLNNDLNWLDIYSQGNLRAYPVHAADWGLSLGVPAAKAAADAIIAGLEAKP
jgi:hypothetical protein